MSRSGLWSRLRDKVSRLIHQARLRCSMRHIHGPKQPKAGPGDVIIVALVRDGLFYLEGFLAHYRSLGARHFVFIDNGSTDGTIAKIMQEPGTVIVRSHLPWGLFENDFRGYAARTYCAGHWCLYADMDEQFDFEGSQAIGLKGLVRYLDINGFTCLMAQMLEMFPDAPLRETTTLPFADVLTRYRFYDPGHIRTVDYHDPAIPFSFYLGANTLANAKIKFLFGGVRRKVFGEDCALSKHPLVFVTAGVDPGIHPHCASGVACADFTAVIRHYKFTNTPFGRDAQSVRNAAISHGEDRQRLKVAGNDPDLSLFSEDAREFTGIADLQDIGFLIASSRFTAFVNETPDG